MIHSRSSIRDLVRSIDDAAAQLGSLTRIRQAELVILMNRRLNMEFGAQMMNYYSGVGKAHQPLHIGAGSVVERYKDMRISILGPDENIYVMIGDWSMMGTGQENAVVRIQYPDINENCILKSAHIQPANNSISYTPNGGRNNLRA